MNFSKNEQMNLFLQVNMRRVFVRFFEEIEDSKKAFWNYLTFSKRQNHEEDFFQIMCASQKVRTLRPKKHLGIHL